MIACIHVYHGLYVGTAQLSQRIRRMESARSMWLYYEKGWTLKLSMDEGHTRTGKPRSSLEKPRVTALLAGKMGN